MPLIRIVKQCNQHCLFCGVDPRNEQDFVLDEGELFRQIAESAPEDIIEISGGEPTLSPVLLKILAFARSRKRRISLQTNAMRCAQPRVVETLVKAGLTQVFVSLHAPNARLSDAITRTPGSFDLTVRGIENLLNAGVTVAVNCVICQANRKRLVEYVRFVRERFGSGLEVVFSFVNPFHDAWNHPKVIPRISSIQDELQKALLVGEQLGLDMHVPDVCGIPLCFLKKHERFADKYTDIQKKRPFKPHHQKEKGSVCSLCRWDSLCDGLWTRYVERYGTDELEPVVQEGKGESSSCHTTTDTALLIGTHCNNNCIFCNEVGQGSRQPMSLKEAEKLLAARRPEWVFLSYGEPTTSPALIDYIDLAKRYGAMRVTLTSNGSGLIEYSACERLIQHGVSEFRLSIHGPDAAMHDRLTRREGSFRDVQKAIDNLNRLKTAYPIQTVALAVINRLNLPTLDSLIRWFIRHDFSWIGLGVIEPKGNALKNFQQLVPRYSEVAASLEEIFARLSAEGCLDDVDILVDSLPPCLMQDAAVALGTRSTIRTMDQRSGLLWEMRVDRDKTYGPPCEACRLREGCEGVWSEYVSRFGWSEFGES